MITNLDETVVFIIANAGDSRSLSIEAVNYAKEGDFTKASEYLKMSEEALQKAHNAHTRLLAHESKEGIEITLLVVHASNHLSIAEVFKHFSEELVELHERNGHKCIT